MKVAIYARYSSENQRDASIEDQFRICREFARKQGWHIQREYSDHAISGASLMRPGFQAMMAEALRGQVDTVLAEALDRFSRDQEDTAGLFKRLTFAGVNIVTLAEGDITHLHIGLKGTMNALFLKELADKTRRGLRGRIELGKSGGGVSFGYRIVRTFKDGVVSTGEREIVPEEAEVVRRIFSEYAAGQSPKQIAKDLNRSGLRGPRGALWSPSTIHGNPKRGVGILHNELYVGRMVWNKLRYLKDPDTGKRVSRPNPESEWVVSHVPALRIIDDELWQAVQTRYAGVQRKWKSAERGKRFNQFVRPKYLFSGLTKCGECGAGYVVYSRDHLGCFGTRDRGTCSNKLTISRHEVEERVLSALQEKLLRKDFFEEFCREFAKEMNRLRMEQRASLSGAKRELDRVKRDIEKVVDADHPGLRRPELKTHMEALPGEEGRPAGPTRHCRRAAAAPAPEHGRPLPGQGRGVGRRAPARRQSGGSGGDAPRTHRCDRLDSGGGPAPNRAEGESGRDADCRPENEKVARNWRPFRADSNGCGGGFEPPTFGL